jgi:alkylation response protein AidB-like acyl-CoA dehydrogenase
MDRAHLSWPFFDPAHGALAAEVDAWAAREVATAPPHDARADVDAICRRWVRRLGAAGYLAHCVPARFGGASARIDSRTLCVLRETLAYHDGLADFAFAMQGLGSGPLALAADDDGPTDAGAARAGGADRPVGGEAEADAARQARHWLPRVARGEAIAAFALSEPGAGSDAAALALQATRDGDGYVLDGSKTWISNGGIADFYTTFARTGGAGADGISAFVVPAETPGLRVAERIETLAPHPLARLAFEAARLPAQARLGDEGDGFRLAMRTLDIFRASVGAAALGFARRALDLALAHASSRRMFGGTLAGRDLARAKLGELATLVDAAALLVYRAAWMRDVRGVRTTMEAAMAKMSATEWAQRVIDGAVQLHGGLGVTVGQPIERLYREIRALRIYEGATEVQQLIIGKSALRRIAKEEGT